MLLRRIGGLSATVSRRLRHSLSTASSSRPEWAMISHAPLVQSPVPRPSFQLLEPPCPSRLLVPLHLVDPVPHPDAGRDAMDRFYGGFVEARSGDALLLLVFGDLRGMDLRSAAEATNRAINSGVEFGPEDPDMLRFVCNPVSGEMFRLPDAGGTKKHPTVYSHGILTHSARGHGPPDRYAVAQVEALVNSCRDAMIFTVRWFLSQTGKWDKLVCSGIPHGLRLGRPMSLDHETLAFAGRLWLIGLSWGALSFDPFSDRPDFRFHELPLMQERVEAHQEERGRYRRMGVSQGKLRYAEVSKEEPFVLSSFVLDNDSGSWKLEHRMALSRLLMHDVRPCQQQEAPRIAVVDPVNASVMLIKDGDVTLAVDMDKEKVLGCSMSTEENGDDDDYWCFKQCVLPH